MVNYRWAPVHAYRKFLATALWTAVEAIAFVWDTLHNCYVKIRIFVLFVIFCIGKNSFFFMMCCWQVELSKEFGIPVESQRFWVWAKRQNSTYRPSRPLNMQEENTAVSGMPILDVLLLFDAVRIQFKLFFKRSNSVTASTFTMDDGSFKIENGVTIWLETSWGIFFLFSSKQLALQVMNLLGLKRWDCTQPCHLATWVSLCSRLASKWYD